MSQATKKQINYIEILVIDLILSRKQRNALISLKLNRNIKYLDELTLDEAAQIITYFKFLKEDMEIREARLAQIEMSFDDNSGKC